MLLRLPPGQYGPKNLYQSKRFKLDKPTYFDSPRARRADSRVSGRAIRRGCSRSESLSSLNPIVRQSKHFPDRGKASAHVVFFAPNREEFPMSPFTRGTVRELKRLKQEVRERFCRSEKADELDAAITKTIGILALLNADGARFARDYPHLAA